MYDGRLSSISLRLAAFAVAVGMSTLTLIAPATAQPRTPPRHSLDEVTTERIPLNGASPGVIDAPQQLAVTPNAVWIVYHRAGRVDRLDPTTNTVVASVDVPVPGCVPGGCSGLEQIAADERNVWVFNNEQSTLVHIDPLTNQVVGSVATDGQVFTAPVIDGDSVWASLSQSGDVVRISAGSNEVVQTVHVRDALAWPLAIVRGALWIASYDPTASRGRQAMLHQVDRATGLVTKTVRGVAGSDAHTVGGDLWLSGCVYLGFVQQFSDCQVLRKVDGRTGALEAEVPIEGAAVSAATVDDHTLVVDRTNGPGTPSWLVVVDTTRKRPTAIYEPAPSQAPEGLAFGHGSLWVTSWSTNTVSRVSLPKQEPAGNLAR